MMRVLVGVVATLGALGLLTGKPPEATAKIRVVASLPDLKSLTEAVGGDLVEVDTLARGDQNPHDIEVRPSLMVKLRRADLLVRNGLEGDPWVEPLLLGANNGRLVRGNAGHVDVSPGITVLGAPSGRVDRSMGDVHPAGNPHFTLDPGTAATVTAHIVEGLSRVAAAQRPTFESRRREFLARLDAAMARWQQALAPFRGAPVVLYHDLWRYFLERFGLKLAATIEDRPGIPPSPSHIAEVIRQIKEQKIRVVITEPWADQKLVELIAREGGARSVLLSPAVGGVKGVGSYLELFEYNVSALAQALR